MPKKPFQRSKEELLAHEIHLLSTQVRRLNSFKHRFTLGIITGLGSALGATVIFSVILLVLAQLGQVGALRPFTDWFLGLATK